MICALAGMPSRAETQAEHLLALVESQDLDRIGAYLAQPGVNINDRPGGIKTLLDFAAEGNRVKVVQYLLDHGADVNVMTQGQINVPGNPAGMTPLCRAAYFNAIETMDLLFKHGAEVNSPPGRASAIMFAAKNGNLKAVEMLVAHGADVNHEFGVHQTAISEATQGGHLDVAKYLANHGATMGRGAVNLAAGSGNPDLVSLALASNPDQELLNLALTTAASNNRADEATRQRILGLLLAHGANPDSPQNGLPAGMLPEATTVETVKYLLDHGANAQAKLSGSELAAGIGCRWLGVAKDPLPLYRMLVARGMDFRAPQYARANPVGCAAGANRTDVIDFLLDHGADVTRPDGSGQVPIFRAATRAVIEDLLKHGASLDQTGEQVLTDGTLQPIPQMTPLSSAIESGQWDRVALLISMGADVRTRGGSFLANAAVGGQTDFVTLLLNHGVDVNARDTLGGTALQAVARIGNLNMAQRLLDLGADVNGRDRMGRTALLLAVEAGSSSMVKLLLAHGADASIGNNGGIAPFAEARSMELRSLLAGGSAAPITDGTSRTDVVDCTGALRQHSNHRAAAGDAPAPDARDPGEDWDFLDQIAGSAGEILISGRSYLFAVAEDGGYLARVDTDGVERIVCEYGKFPGGESSTVRALTEYERLQARSQRDFVSISRVSLKLQGLRGAEAILAASRRARNPVPLAFNSDDNLLGDAIGEHRDDILAYYLQHGVDANLDWREHTVVDGTHAPSSHRPPLFYAAANGTDQAVVLLLAHGANPDAAESPPQPGPQWVGKPALAVVVLSRDSSVVETLLAHGANPDMPSAHGFPPGTGIYSGFATTIGNGINQWVVGQLFKSQRSGPDLVANAAVLFRHGASPDPWLYTIMAELQLRARGNIVRLPQATLNAVAVAPESGQVRQVEGELRATFPALADLLAVALRYRDAPQCDGSTAPDDSPYCLPKSLHTADVNLTVRYEALLKRLGPDATAARSAQRAWIRERDKACAVKELIGVTQGGWLAYVLSDPARAQCVLQHTRGRTAALPPVAG